MDKTEALEILTRGAGSLGISLGDSEAKRLLAFMDGLLRWNQKTNLTAIRDPIEVLEKHLLDSLALLPEAQSARELLDLGSGAGFPGVPVKLVSPSTSVVLVDANQKKVAFMKRMIVQLGLLEGTEIICARAAGQPESERIPKSLLVVSRALSGLGQWLALGRNYLKPDGKLVAMLGPENPSDSDLSDEATKHGMTLDRVRAYRLPLSGAGRRLAVFSR